MLRIAFFADRVSNPVVGFVKKDDLRIGDQGPRPVHSLCMPPRSAEGYFARFAEFCLFNSGHDPAIDFRFAKFSVSEWGWRHFHRPSSSRRGRALKHVTHLA